MTRQLTPDSRLDTFRKEAKRWLKALRVQDAEALARLRRSHPTATAEPGLRDVQHALAREHGLENWAALKAALEQNAIAGRNREELLAEFLEHACLRYGNEPGAGGWNHRYYDDPTRWRYAARILQQHPQLAKGNIHAAAVSGDLAEVERILKARPAAASEPAKLDGRLPLEYVCYGRLPVPAAAESLSAIAKALLDAGAPCQHPLPDDNDAHFQPLTAAIGGGENDQPPHPQAVALATLLIERGADPYDAQALYDTSLSGNDLFWLNFLYDRSAQRGETGKWTRPSSRWPKSPMVDFLLIMAAHRNQIERAKWALSRGADPRCRHHYYAPRNLHTDTVVNGYTQIADLLLQHGGVADKLSGTEAFQAACVRMDRETVERLVKEHPEYLKSHGPLMAAASRDLRDVAEMLLDLGMPPDLAGPTNFRPLHAAATNDAVEVGKLLIERGAEIDPEETRFDGVPLGWAIHNKKPRMMALLGAVSRNARALIWMGNVARLREIFAEDASLARVVNARGSLFFYLPEDEDVALEIAELLLANGTDPTVKAKDGTTAVEHAQKQGLHAVVDLLTASA